MPYDIKSRLQELVAEDSSRARDKDILFRMVMAEVRGKELELFGLLLTDYINHHVRRPGTAKPRLPSRRTAAPVAQASPQQRALIMESAGKRPLFLPSLVSNSNDGWVAYDDMTEDNWREYISSRQRISRVSTSLATWGSDNLKALHEYKAPTTGRLPDQVRQSLLRRMPQSSGRELPAIAEGAREREVSQSA